MDVFEKSRLVHAHLFRKNARIDLPRMIEIPLAVAFQQYIFLPGGEDTKNPVDMGIIVADRKDLEPPTLLRGIGNERMEILGVPDHVKCQAIVLEDNRVFELGSVGAEEPGNVIGKSSLDEAGIFASFAVKHDEIRYVVALDLVDGNAFPDGKLAHLAVHVIDHVEERNHLEPFDDLTI